MSEITLFYAKFVLLIGVYALLGLLIRALIKDIPMPSKTSEPLASPVSSLPSPDSSGWWLSVLQGQERLEGRDLELREELLLGRAPECRVVVNDPFASARHARLVPRGAGVWLEDLGSTNGTFLGAEAVQGGVLLNEGGRFSIGDVTFELVRRGNA